MYEAGLSTSFKAWHVMPGVPGPESRPHQHDYRMEIVASRRHLDEHGMVCDLDVLQAALDDVVAMVRDGDLEVIRPPDRYAVTVEVLAHWGHAELSRRLRDAGVENLTVRVWESPVAFGAYRAPVSVSDS